MTHDCALRYAANHTVKFADDTTVVGLIREDNNLAYRKKVEQLLGWSKDNSLILNVGKTKEIMGDFRMNWLSRAPTPRLWRWSAAPTSWGAHHRHSRLVCEHCITGQESTAAHVLSAEDEESPHAPTHPHYILQ